MSVMLGCDMQKAGLACLVYQLRAVRPEFLIVRMLDGPWTIPGVLGPLAGGDQQLYLLAELHNHLKSELGLDIKPELFDFADSYRRLGPFDAEKVLGATCAARYLGSGVKLAGRHYRESRWIVATAIPEIKAREGGFLNSEGEAIHVFDQSRPWTFA